MCRFDWLRVSGGERYTLASLDEDAHPEHCVHPHCFVYGLIDPTTRLIFYIGQTTKGMQRPRQHAARGWIYEIAILEAVDEQSSSPSRKRPTSLHEAERWWIAYGRASGWPLRNLANGGGGRATVVAPVGRVTLTTAAKMSGLSYPEVHRRVAIAKTAPGEQDPDTRAWTMTLTDAESLGRRNPAPARERPGTNLRAAPERWAAWENEAERRGMAVSALAARLLDEASGWSK